MRIVHDPNNKATPGFLSPGSRVGCARPGWALERNRGSPSLCLQRRRRCRLGGEKAGAAGRGAGPCATSNPLVFDRISTWVPWNRRESEPVPARRLSIVSSGVRGGVHPAQDRDQTKDRARRPRLGHVRPQVLDREAAGGPRQSREELRQPIRDEPLGGVEHSLRNLGRLRLEPVAPEPARNHRVVVRPDGARVIAERVVSDVLRGECPDSPTRPHVIGQEPADDALCPLGRNDPVRQAVPGI